MQKQQKISNGVNEEKTTPKHPTTVGVTGQVKKFFRNRDILKWVIVGLAGFAALVLVFGAGIKVGVMKAKYSYRWAENYHRNFGGPQGGFFSDLKSFPHGEFINGHGVFGSIIKIDGNTIIAKDKDDVEKTILVFDSTIIEKGREKVQLPDLKVDENIVIIGSPNDKGQIEAKFIRVFDGSVSMGLPIKSPRHIPFF